MRALMRAHVLYYARVYTCCRCNRSAIKVIPTYRKVYLPVSQSCKAGNISMAEFNSKDKENQSPAIYFPPKSAAASQYL